MILKIVFLKRTLVFKNAPFENWNSYPKWTINYLKKKKNTYYDTITKPRYVTIFYFVLVKNMPYDLRQAK